MNTQPRLKHALPAVYAVAALRVLFPLAVLPLMAARLGADEFGRLSQLLLWAALLSVGVEGGFLAAATRHAVAADAAQRATLARQVFSARCVLSLGAAALALAIGLATTDGWHEAALLALLACATGWPATWYLQATGQLHRFALVEGGVHAVWLGLLFWLAHSVQSYLLLNGAALALLALLGWRRVRADLPPPARLWSRADCGPGLALGGAMLPVSMAGAAYAYALPAVAALQMPRAELGLYYLADRWVRALLMASDPLAQLVYPRIVQRFQRGARAAFAYAARWAAAGLLVGALALAAGWAWWPQIARHLPAGVDATALAAVLGVSACLLPLLLGWKPIGLWMLGSARFDGAYRACMVAGAVAGVAAVALLQVQQARTLAWVALAVEGLVIVVALVGIARGGAMGIDIHNLNFLAHAQDLGVRFERTLAIGRQVLHVEPRGLQAHRRLRGLPDLPLPSGTPWFEPLLQQWYGAVEADSVDASAYEGASILHDMNLPWPAQDAARGHYDAVLDFGCLEHVFDFPTAWRNLVAVTRVGGHILHALPANNLCGHGFYQFSPELFFNLYRPEQGFDLKAVFFALRTEPRHWWRVANPLTVRRRVNLCNGHEVYLLVLARKLAELPPGPAPQQSDYAMGDWVAGGPAVAPAPAAPHPATTWLDRAGQLDRARRWRDRFRALRGSALNLPAPDYQRLVVDRLIARGG